MTNNNGKTVLELDQNALSNFPEENIENHYVAKIKSSKHSMVIPLGPKQPYRCKMKGYPFCPMRSTN